MQVAGNRYKLANNNKFFQKLSSDYWDWMGQFRPEYCC